MVLDYGLDDVSANLSRKILRRGIHNLEIFLINCVEIVNLYM